MRVREILIHSKQVVTQKLSPLQILARLSYNLNLPADFMRHLHTIFIISSPNVVFNAQFTHRFSSVDSEMLLQRTNNAYCDNITFALEESTYLLEDGLGRQ